MSLVNYILAELLHQRWNQTCCKMPMNMGATNLYSTALDKKGINLWCVRWHQALDLPLVDPSTLADFLRAYTTIEPVDPVDTSVPSLTISVSLNSSPVLAIGTTTLPAAVVNVAYSQALTVVGGISPYVWALTSGSLPAGLTIDPSSGLISGTPTMIGTSTFTAQVVCNTATADAALSLIVGAT
jgi:hypothetical protein